MADYLVNEFDLTYALNDNNQQVALNGAVAELQIWQDLFGDVFDTTHWTDGVLWGTDIGALDESGGVVDMQTTDLHGMYSNLTFGDLDVSVEVANFVKTRDHNLYFYVAIDSTHYVAIVRQYDVARDCIRQLSSGGGWGAQFDTVVTAFKLRVKRVGDQWTIYYDVGAGWVQLATWSEAIGTPAQIWLRHQVVNAATYGLDAVDCQVTGSARYCMNSPEIRVIDTGVDYAIDAGAGKVWSLTAISTVQDDDGGSVKYKVGWSDTGLEAGVTWLDATWQTAAEINTNAANGDYDGHRYVHVKAQFNSDGTQQPTLTSVTFTGTAGAPIHTWSQDNTHVKEGAYSFKQVGPAIQSDDYFMREIDVVVGEDYYVEVFGDCDVAPTAGYFYLQAYDQDGAAEIDIAKLTTTATTDFVKFSFYFTAPAGCTKVEIRIGGNIQGGTMYWDCCDSRRIRAKGYV